MTSEADDILTKIIQREIHRRAGNVTSTSNSLQKKRKKKLLLKKKKKKKKEKTVEAVAKINTILPKKVKKHKGPTIFTDVYTKKTKIADATIQNVDLDNLEKNEKEKLLSIKNKKDIKKKSKNEKSFTCDQENKVKSKVYDTIPSKKMKKRKHQTVVHTNDTHHKNINICKKPSQFYSVSNTTYTKNRPVNNDDVAANITSNNLENMGLNSLLVKKKKKKKKKKNIEKKCIEEKEYDTKIHAVNNDIAATTLTSNNTESIEFNSLLLRTLVKKLKKKKKEKIKVAGVLGIMSPKKSKKHKQQSSCDLYNNEVLENDISAVLTDENSIDKIYKCDVCKMTFTFLSTLEKHKAKRHIVDKDTVALFDSSKCSNDYKMLKLLNNTLEEPKNVRVKAKKDILLNASSKKKKKIKQQSMCNQSAENDVTVYHADDMLNTKCHKCNVCCKSFECADALNDHWKKVHIKIKKTVVHTNTSINAEDDKEITLLLEKMSNKIYKKKEKNKEQNENASTIVGDKYQEECNVAILVNKTHPKNSTKRKQLTASAVKSDLMKPYRTDENRYACDVCDTSFSHQSAFIRHYRTHTGEKPFACDVCGGSFSQQSTLTTHYRTHTGGKPFACDVCGRSFTTKSNLTVHYRIHTGDEPYACDVCAKSFSDLSNFTSHYRTHTDERPYACDVCGNSFITKRNLTIHYRTHTGEKPHACNVCGGSFSQQSTLIAHYRTHTGEKPHACDVCGGSFSERSSLVKHYRTHTGEKPYACCLCDMSFSTNYGQKNHIRRKHNNCF